MKQPIYPYFSLHFHSLLRIRIQKERKTESLSFLRDSENVNSTRGIIVFSHYLYYNIGRLINFFSLFVFYAYLFSYLFFSLISYTNMCSLCNIQQSSSEGDRKVATSLLFFVRIRFICSYTDKKSQQNYVARSTTNIENSGNVVGDKETFNSNDVLILTSEI
jgi:hypothetical protein